MMGEDGTGKKSVMYKMQPYIIATDLSCLQPPTHAGSTLADFSTLKMEAIRSSETSLHTRYTLRHIPEDGILHNHRRGNLKYYNIKMDRRKTDRKDLKLTELCQ
jgi:hypothetical protein